MNSTPSKAQETKNGNRLENFSTANFDFKSNPEFSSLHYDKYTNLRSNTPPFKSKTRARSSNMSIEYPRKHKKSLFYKPPNWNKNISDDSDSSSTLDFNNKVALGILKSKDRKSLREMFATRIIES